MWQRRAVVCKTQYFERPRSNLDSRELTSRQDSVRFPSHASLRARELMQSPPIQMLTICGISELSDQRERSVTHVLSILDPDHPDPEAFEAYDPHHRTILRFHDIINPIPGMILPAPEHVEAILRFGDEVGEGQSGGGPSAGPLPHGRVAFDSRDADAARPVEPAGERGQSLRAPRRDQAPGLAELAHDRASPTSFCRAMGA